MPTFEPEDFWAALHRLYERQLQHDEQIGQLIDQGKRTDARLEQLITIVGDLAAIVRSHEQRLERLEGQA